MGKAVLSLTTKAQASKPRVPLEVGLAQLTGPWAQGGLRGRLGMSPGMCEPPATFEESLETYWQDMSPGCKDLDSGPC